MQRVLVTGASGFTGRHLVPVLVALGYEVHGLVGPRATSVNGPHTADSYPFRSHVGDLLDAGRMSEIVALVRPTRVVHLAAISFAAHTDVEAIYRSNLIGTRNLLAALSKMDSPPEMTLVASSAVVYGNAAQGSLDESSSLAPSNDYAVSKLAMEYMTRLFQGRLPLTIVRPFNYTGRGQSESFVIPKIVAHFREARPVLELGNIEVERDFSDVRMVVESYARLLDTPAASGGVFNICSGAGTSLRSILDIAAQLSGHRLEVRINPAFVRANDPVRVVGSRRALDEAIGGVTAIDIRDTIEWMLR